MGTLFGLPRAGMRQKGDFLSSKLRHFNIRYPSGFHAQNM
ncbi:hypothetical protein TRICHSKD4_2448 [Roseibium sp. TrichSKD4]|nr:hypothetical protein TRICHSKD4_2448 [Roseibium sp. TrichSKD4]